MSLYDGQPDPQTPLLPEADTVQQGNFLIDAMGAQGLGYSSSLGEASRATQLPFKSVTTTFDDQGNPQHDIKGVSQAYLDHIQRQVKFATQAQAMLAQVADAAKRKAQVLQEHPVLASIGRTASAVAAQYAAPGSRGQAIVRGLGAFGSDFFQDTPEELLARAAGAQEKQFDIEGKLVNQYEDVRRFDIQEQRAAREESRSEEQLKIARDRQRANAQDDFMRVYEQNAGQGEETADAFKAAAAARPDLFSDQKEIDARYQSLKMVADAAQRRIAREHAQKMSDRLFEINQRRLDRAATVATGQFETKARLYLNNISTANAKLAALYNDQTNARGFFGSIAARLGQKEPTTQEEAKKLLSLAMSDKGAVKLGPRLQEDVFKTGFKQLGALDIKAQEAQIKGNLRAYKSRLPADLRGMIEQEPTPKEINTDTNPQTGKPQLSKQSESLLKEWWDRVPHTETNYARGKEMEQELLAGKMPDEFKIKDQQTADEGPIRAFESFVESLKPDEQKAKKRREAWNKFWLRQLEPQGAGAPTLRNAP